jgi:transposase
VLAGTASGAPKTRTGPVEAIRALRVARRGAVKARTAALNQLHGLLTSAPEQLRADLAALSATELVTRSADLRIDVDRLSEPVMATKAALRAIARRVQALDEEIELADIRLRPR